MNEATITNIKLRINEARNRRNMPVLKLAKKLDVSIGTIYQWESLDNDVLPRVIRLIDLCKQLGVSTDWLLTGKCEA